MASTLMTNGATAYHLVVVQVLVTLAAALLAVNAASGQNYPSKPIRIVVAGPGGGPDFVARQIAQALSVALAQQVIVENRPAGVIPGEIVSKAPPDGYTLLVAAGGLWSGPLMQKTPYDPVRDFSPISLVSIAPNILVAHPSLPVQTVGDLIALAKAKPGELNYGTSGTGGSAHLAGELFKAMAGVNIVRVPYKSGSMLMADIIGGHVHLTFGNAATVPAHLKSGRLRALAVTSVKPSALVPGLPPIAATVPGYEFVGITALFGPSGTTEAIIARLNEEVVRFLRTAAAKETFLSNGAEPVASSPEQLATAINKEMERLGKIIRDNRIRAE